MVQLDKRKTTDVLIIGRVTIDLNPTDYYNTLDKNKNFNLYLGGSAANVAVGIANYNHKVDFISRVSSDQFGKFILDYLKNKNIDPTNIQIDPKRKVGLTFTEMLNENESTILMYRDHVADLAIDPTLITENLVANAKILFISATSLSSSPSREACLKVLSYAKKHNALIIFDLDYRPYTWTSKEETAIYYELVANSSHIIIGSREEFSYLDYLQYGENQADNDLIARYWLNKNSQIVIIKEGKNGSYLYTKDKKLQAKILKVKMLKGFGGGDAYASTFIHCLLEQKDLKEALASATAAASMVVASLSSSDNLPKSYQELIDFMKDYNYSCSNEEYITELDFSID